MLRKRGPGGFSYTERVEGRFTERSERSYTERGVPLKEKGEIEFHQES